MKVITPHFSSDFRNLKSICIVPLQSILSYVDSNLKYLTSYLSEIRMKTFKDHITKKLFDQTEKANVKESKKDEKTELTHLVENRDAGKIIGE